MKFNLVAAVLACASIVGPAVAAPVTLTFEGVGNRNPVGTFYQASYDVTFAASALGLVDSDVGGSGDIENEPSPSTVMYYRGTDNGTTMNRAGGIVDRLSFYYTSAVPGTVAVYSGVDGTGGLLGSVSLINQAAIGCANSSASFCNWTPLDILFAGTARSVVFTSQAALSAFDDITFTAAAAVTPVPTPATLPLVLAALGGVALASRRRRT